MTTAKDTPTAEDTTTAKDMTTAEDTTTAKDTTSAKDVTTCRGTAVGHCIFILPKQYFCYLLFDNFGHWVQATSSVKTL